MISVVLASRLALIREGMKRILQSEGDIRVVGEVLRAQDVVSNKETPDAEVVVVAHPANLDGEDYLHFLQQQCPSLRVIIVANSPTLPHVLSALRKGARGILNACCSAEHLPAAIRAVSAGNIYMHEEVARMVVQDLGEIRKDHTHRSLTQRELQIFVKLATGLKVSAIALELGISIKTVSTHKARIMEKMGITTFSQLVQYAIANRFSFATESPAEVSEA